MSLQADLNSHQGMEDSHSVHLYMPPPGGDPPVPSSESIPEQPAGSSVTNDSTDVEGNAFFGVFDGHGGSSVAKFTGRTIHTRLADLDAYSECNHLHHADDRKRRVREGTERGIFKDRRRLARRSQFFPRSFWVHSSDGIDHQGWQDHCRASSSRPH